MSTVTSKTQTVRYETWTAWPVSWTAIWIGVLSALALALVFGLVGTALGAHVALPGGRVLSWNDFSIGALVFSVFGAFLSFALGGWVAGKIAGIRHSEPAALHGAIVWVVAVPIIVILAAFGAGTLFGSWYAALAGHPAWAAVASTPPDPDALAAARNAALGAVTGLLLGLAGSILGGWLASGEPMSWKYDRTRVTTSTVTR